MEDLHALDLASGLQIADLRSLGIGARIALGGHDDRERRLGAPARRHAAEHAVAGGLHQQQQIVLETHDEDLRLGIAEAHVVFDELRPLGRDHEPGIEHAAIGRALRAERPDGRFHDLAEDALCELGREDGGRRVSAHAARVGAPVAVVSALVVLRARQRQHGLAVHEGEIAGFVAFEELLDHDRFAGGPEGA